MKAEAIETTFTLEIPVDTPNANGMICPKDVLIDALYQWRVRNNNLPIHGVPEFGYSVKDPNPLGYTTGSPTCIQYDPEHNVVRFCVNAVINSGGVECVVNKENNKITEINVTGLALDCPEKGHI